MAKTTPEWMDELLERENISWDEYYESFEVDRREFWQLYDANPETVETVAAEAAGMTLGEFRFHAFWLMIEREVYGFTAEEMGE